MIPFSSSILWPPAHVSILHPPNSVCHFPEQSSVLIHIWRDSLAPGRFWWLSQSRERLSPAAGTHLQAQQEGRGATLSTFHVGLRQVRGAASARGFIKRVTWGKQKEISWDTSTAMLWQPLNSPVPSPGCCRSSSGCSVILWF